MPLKTICPVSGIVVFQSDGSKRAWGHLETKHAQLGLVYRENPTPQLAVAPPMRVPEGQADRFLEGVVDAYEQTGDELWMALGCDPRDGEVVMRLSPKSRNRVDDDIARAQAFFDEQFPVLARLCLPDSETCIEDDGEDDEEGFGALLARMLAH